MNRLATSGLLLIIAPLVVSQNNLASLCNQPSVAISGRCLYVYSRTVVGFAAAEAACGPNRHLFSLTDADLTRLNSIIGNQFSPGTVFLTSGVRAGPRWTWEDGTEIQISPLGDGRCLGLRLNASEPVQPANPALSSISLPIQGPAVTAPPASTLEWLSIDCGSTYVPLCESGLECVDDKASKYDGETARTASGRACVNWNHPLLPRVDPSWSHNYCRLVQGQDFAGCFTGPATFEACSIPVCTSPSKDAVLTKCAEGLLPCGESDQCLPKNSVRPFPAEIWPCFKCFKHGPQFTSLTEFFCDYEQDCTNGADEVDCEDYLKNFELIGSFKIVEKISEIWTNIPNVQGCARRCSSSSLVCEAFSFSPRAQLCLLTDSSSLSSSLLSPRSSSIFYRRRFSPKEIEVRLLSSPSYLLLAAKDGNWASICDDGFSHEYATTLCGIFEFGSALPSSPSPSMDTTSWSLECLRNEKCTAPASTGCLQLRCSKCREAVCGDGTCLSRAALCNGLNDCPDGSDERGCADVEWRLVSGADETQGRLEVHFRGEWDPVCAQTVNVTVAEAVCLDMEMGTPSSILPPGRSARHFGRLVECELDGCRVAGTATCHQQAVVQCRPSQVANTTSAQCGVRTVAFTARDPKKQRFARVVGGFEASAGSFPWTAAVRLRVGHAHHCGATLIHPRFLLTAAHCFEDDRRPSTYDVVVGDWDNNVTEGTEETLRIASIHFYPLYQDLFSHDIAIVELASPAKLTPFVALACLPQRDFRYTTGRRCVVSGWGSMGLRYPSRLQAALVPIIDRAACVNSSKIYESLSRSAFCAGYLEGGIDSCQGDSGGPLVCQEHDGIYYLAGVISWGDGCAQKNQPGIYTMVAPYLSWIEDVIGGGKKKKEEQTIDFLRRHRTYIGTTE